jgi:hypothetical protein
MEHTALHEAAMRQAQVASWRLSRLRLAYRKNGVRQFIQEQASERRLEYEQYQNRVETANTSE